MKIPKEITPSSAAYLKLIYHLQKTQGKATVKDIAEGMGVKSASVTSMAKKLASLKVVNRSPYRTIALTPAGKKIALEIVRHHRLLELYLREALGYGLDKVHDEAERLEHVISEEFEVRMDAMLGSPRIDPHGSPIPGTDGRMIERNQVPLREVPAGGTAEVSQLASRTSEKLGYLEGIGLVPGARVTVLEKKPHGGPVHIRIGSKTRETVGFELAGEIFVRSEGGKEGL